MSEYVPLYKQLREMLRSQIETGQLPVGTTLAPEIELAETFGVSRSTMRSAILGLVEEGLLKRRPKAGTVVIRARHEEQRSYFRGLTEDLKRKGVVSTVTVLSKEVVTASSAVAAQLHLSQGDRVLKLTRLRKIAGVPLVLMHAYVPDWVGIGIDSDFNRPLYMLIEKSGRLHITYGEDILGAANADERVAALLEVQVGTAVLTVRRSTFVEHARPVEYVTAFLRSDLYEYHVLLPRKETEG